jgi:rod shape-determining protein MreC
MHRIVAFILKRYPFFIFLLLEVVAVTLVINKNDYQRGAYRLGVTDVAGVSYSVWSDITGYFYLKKQNRMLAEENARLRDNMQGSFRASDRKIFVWNDTLYQQQFQYVSARIVNASVNRQKNFLMINKGSNQGIEQNMGVIAGDGIVGMVKSVSANYALVLPVIHLDANISARLKRNDQKGIVSWDGKHFTYATMKGIPGHIGVERGDTIITSGQSIFFPEGLRVGYVSDFTQNRSDNFFTITLRLAVDFNSIQYVYVIRNLLAAEQLKLLEETEHAE